MMEILASRYNPARDRFECIQELTSGEVQGLVHLTFPADILEWRAAEYSIDPRETDLLMDIVLYERFLPEPEDGIHTLWKAGSVEEARAIHVNDVMGVKQQLRPNGPNSWKTNPQRLARMKQAHPSLADDWGKDLTEDSLLSIRQSHAMDPEVVAEKIRVVVAGRGKAAQVRLAKAARLANATSRPSPAARAAMIRAAMIQGD